MIRRSKIIGEKVRRRAEHISGRGCTGIGLNISPVHNKFMVLHHLKNENGSLSLQLTGMYLLIIIVCFAVIAGAGFGARKQAVMTYDWFGEAMDYASSGASMQSFGMGLQLNQPVAESLFILSFEDMTDTTYTSGIFLPNQSSAYKGPIMLNRFEAVSGYGANQPGYIAEITVPVMGADLPLIGNQYITVPMRYFAVGRNTFK